jgi:hypothetical protein
VTAPRRSEPVTRFELFASWGPRTETPKAIAERLQPFLGVLSRELPAVGPLYRARDTPREPLVPIGTSVAELASQIESQIVRNDTDHRAMDGAGYYALWDDNTRRLERVELDLNVGGTNQANWLSLRRMIRTEH